MINILRRYQNERIRRGRNYRNEDNGIGKLPLWIIDKETRTYMKAEDLLVFMCVLLYMQLKETDELQLSLEAIEEFTQLEQDKIQLALDRLINYGFFRNIKEKSNVHSLSYYLVNMNLQLVEVK